MIPAYKALPYFSNSVRQVASLGFFLCMVMLLSSTSLHAQDHKTRQIDSLKALFPKQKGVEKIESLFTLSSLVADYDLDSAIYLDSMALDILKDSYQSLWHVKLLADLSYFHTLKFDYPPAKLLLDSALVIGKRSKSKKEMIIVHSDLGGYFFDLNLFDSALFHYHHALRIDNGGMDPTVRTVLNNIGLIHYRMRNYSRSQEYYAKTLKWNLVKGDTTKTLTNLINIGFIHLDINELGLAEDSFKKALQVEKKYPSNKHLAHAYSGLGGVFLRKNEAEVSRQYLLKAIENGKKVGDNIVIANSYCYLAELELRNNFYQSAKHYLTKSQEIYQEVGNNLLYSHTYHLLYSHNCYLYSQIYEALDQTDSAYYYHKKYLELKDSIYNPDLSHNLTNLQLAYQAEESQQVIQEKEQRLTQTTKYLWLAGMVLLICVVQLFRFYHRFL